MNKNYLITIDGKHITGEDVETVSLSTLGNFGSQDGKFFITYEETEATGFAGDVTTFTVENENLATLERNGRTSSKLFMEKGQKHMCHYRTGAGNLVVGILAETIENRLTPKGGEVKLKYTLDLNSSVLSVNELNITVKENRANARPC